MRRVLIALAAVLTLVPAAFAALHVQERKLPEGTRVLKDLRYGGDEEQALDVYAQPGRSGAPIIVMVHGGGWSRGDKDGRGVVQAKVAHWLPRGYLFVSVNYRMLPGQEVAGQAEDVARALAYVQQHAGEWGGDPGRITLMGHSAGAHLVALLSADPALAEAQGARRWKATVALDSAALDVASIMQRPHLALYDRAFGQDPAQWRQLSPLQQLHAQAVPLMAVCSTLRPDDPCQQAREYTARAKSLGVEGEVLPQALRHADVNRDLGAEENYTAAVDRFIATHAGGGSPTLAR